MILIKFEQSGFILETSEGYRLAFDIGNKTPPQNLEKLKVDEMLISHIHGDHFSLEQILLLEPSRVYMNQECADTLGEETLPFEVKVVKVGDKIFTNGIEVEFFNVDHGPNVSVQLKENFGFLIKIEGKVIYFAGDMFYESGIPIETLEVDIALIPVGTHYTFGPKEALEFVKKFKRVERVVSMHYDKTPETHSEFLDLTKDRFIAE